MANGETSDLMFFCLGKSAVVGIKPKQNPLFRAGLILAPYLGHERVRVRTMAIQCLQNI